MTAKLDWAVQDIPPWVPVPNTAEICPGRASRGMEVSSSTQVTAMGVAWVNTNWGAFESFDARPSKSLYLSLASCPAALTAVLLGEKSGFAERRKCIRLAVVS